MTSRPRHGWGIGLVLALSLALASAGCVSRPTLPATASADGDVTSLPPGADFREAPPSAREPWTALVPAVPVTEPFGGIGNQYAFGIAAYNDGFVAVGEDLQFDGPVDGAIWFSPDGTRWVRLATADNDLANAQIDVVAVSATRLVALGGARGGDHDTGASGRIVWTSDDGRSWRRAGNESVFDGVSPGGLAGGPAGFVAWGTEAGRPVLFRSDDGTAWTRVSTGTLFDDALIAAVESYRGGFVAVGARPPPPGQNRVGGPDQSAAMAWWSPDGRAWAAATVDQGRGLQSVEVGAGGMIALGSGECGGCIGPAALWRSADGRSWHHVGDDVANWPMYGSDGGRIVRDEWQGSGDVFESTDGITWRPIGSHERVDAYGLTVGSHGILIRESIPKGGPPDEVDAGVWYLAAN